MRPSISRKAFGAIAALLALAAAAVLLLPGAGQSAGDPLKIEVIATRYMWTFAYPTEDYAFATQEVHVPEGRPIEFELHSENVLHAFWVPEWKINVDTPPAEVETVEVTPEAGVYQLICAQACGLLHAGMRAKIVVEPQDRYQRWVNGLEPTPTRLRRLVRVDRELEATYEASGSQASG